MRALLPLLVLSGCPPEGDDAPPDPPAEVTVLAGPDLEVPVGVEAVLDGRESSEGDAVWDMGDGTTVPGALARHTWQTPGNYVAVLSVTAPGGLRRSDSVRVTVYLPVADPPPVSSATIAVDHARARVWVPVPEADALAVVDATAGTSRFVPTCAGPRSVAVRGDLVAVSCEAGDEVRLHDAATFAEVDAIELPRGTRPFGIAGRGESWWVVGQARGDLFTVTGAATESSSHGTDLRAVAALPDGAVWATRWRSPSQRGEVYLPGGRVTLALDPGPDTDTGHRGVPNLLEALVVSPDGGTAWIGGTTSNNQRGLARDGLPLTFESMVRSTVRVVDVASGAERLDERKTFDNQDRVTAMALSPRGSWLWVAHAGTGTVDRLDAFTLDVVGGIPDAGVGVNGLALSADGGTLYVHAWLDRTLTAWDVSTPGALPVLKWTAPTVEREPLDAQVLTGKRLFHDSGDTRMSRHGYATCASCHPDGRDDGRVWDFTDRGEGFRNTITLEGHGGTATGMLHWSGNFDEVQDFEADIRNGQGGAGLLAAVHWEVPEIQRSIGDPKAGLSPDLDALAAYVESLTTFPTSPYDHAGDGAVLFTEYGCATCHPPDRLFTDSTVEDALRHDVGTWSSTSGRRLGSPFTAFDTPTLHGVWATPPYLHDGSAPNLEDAIGRHDGPPIPPLDLITLAAWLRTQ